MLSIRTALRTDVGVVRERNEDAAYTDPDSRFVILADGMGGHGGGDVASAMAIDVARTCLEAAWPELVRSRSRGRARVRAVLERAVRLCNDAVVARGQKESDKHQMGTTLELMVLLDGEAFIAHVGDSRTYLVRHGLARQLTTDHTVAEVMRRAGTLDDASASSSQLRSVLANAIGVTGSVSVEHAHVILEDGDRLLVCSDGLYDYFTIEQIADLMIGADADMVLEGLIAAAKAGGGHDNITGVIISVGEAVVDDLDDDIPTNPLASATPGPFHVNDDISGVVERVLIENETRAPIRN